MGSAGLIPGVRVRRRVEVLRLALPPLPGPHYPGADPAGGGKAKA